MQLKFSTIGESRQGLTIPALGVGGSWIVKLPSREYEGVPENEYSMMTLARHIGMDVPAIDLVDVSSIQNLPPEIKPLEGKAFITKRFDRLKDGSAVHIEDFGQIFGIYPRDKYKKANYANIAEVIAAEGAADDAAEFIRRLTFDVLIGNADMHVKNWSCGGDQSRRGSREEHSSCLTCMRPVSEFMCRHREPCGHTTRDSVRTGPG